MPVHINIKVQEQLREKQIKGLQEAYRLHQFVILLLNLLYKFPKISQGWKLPHTVYVNIIRTNEFSANGELPFLVWSCMWAMTGKLQPQNCLQHKTMIVTCVHVYKYIYIFIYLLFFFYFYSQHPLTSIESRCRKRQDNKRRPKGRNARLVRRCCPEKKRYGRRTAKQCLF